MRGFGAVVAVLAISLTAVGLVACGGGATTEDLTVTDEATVTEEGEQGAGGPGGSSADPDYDPGDTVETELETPGGERREKEQVAPPKDQGDCPPGEVEAGGGCIPNQPSG